MSLRRQRSAPSSSNSTSNLTLSTSIMNSYLLLLLSVLLIATTVTANNKNGETPWSIRNNNIKSHVQHWMQDPDGSAREWGHIKNWDLRNVTSLRNLFEFNEEFNEDISQWNVSGVTDFSSAFWSATSFDQNLAAWDVSRAETMKCMFCGASSFRGEGLEAWSQKLNNVQDMYNMFEGSGLDSDVVNLQDWNVSNVITLRAMFQDTPHFRQKLCWNVHHAAVASDMFYATLACFDNSCVLPHISQDAGCSGAFSLGMTAVALMSSLVSLWLL